MNTLLAKRVPTHARTALAPSHSRHPHLPACLPACLSPQKWGPMSHLPLAQEGMRHTLAALTDTVGTGTDVFLLSRTKPRPTGGHAPHPGRPDRHGAPLAAHCLQLASMDAAMQAWVLQPCMHVGEHETLKKMAALSVSTGGRTGCRPRQRAPGWPPQRALAQLQVRRLSVPLLWCG